MLSAQFHIFPIDTQINKPLMFVKKCVPYLSNYLFIKISVIRSRVHKTSRKDNLNDSFMLFKSHVKISLFYVTFKPTACLHHSAYQNFTLVKRKVKASHRTVGG